MRRAARLLAACVASGLAVAAAAQPVQGRVRSVGFAAASGTGYVARDGQWLPILVELTTPGSEPISCELRCERPDLDGDRVSFAERPVVVNPGPRPRRVWCYGVAQSGGDPTFRIDVIGSDGAEITELVIPEFDRLSSESMLVLDISDAPVTQLQAIDSGGAGTGDVVFLHRPYYRTIRVARMAAADLPDRWFGLEAVDVLVWDQPQPGTVSPGQLEALMDWVRNGGHLVLGIGAAWPKVRESRLREIVPLEGTQPTVAVRKLPFYSARFASAGDEEFKSPVAVCTAELKRGAALVLDRVGPTRTVPLIAMDTVGSGRIITTAASLRDLTALRLRGDAQVRLFSQLFDVNPLPEAVRRREAESPLLAPEVALYPALVRPIEFQQLGGALMVLAFLFVAAYILLSTFASWVVLGRRGLRHQSWTVFAGAAVVASAASLGAVQLTRGWRNVQSLSLIDLEAGSSEVRAALYFGYRSPDRQRDDLSLEHEPNFSQPYLRALCGRPLDSSGYATPARYEALATRAQLNDVLMRATLKQFEGFWHGTIAGTIRGRLTARREDGRITPESWLLNELDTPIAGGYLLYIDPRIRDEVGGVPARAMGLTTPYRPDYRGSAEVPAASTVLAVELTALPPQQRVAALGHAEYTTLDAALRRWRSAREPDPRLRPEPATLWDRQVGAWIVSLGPVSLASPARFDSTIAAALLASTRNLYLHNARDGGFDSLGPLLSGEGLADHDVSHWLTRDQALLLLWADGPGPTALHRNGRPMRTNGGRNVYRVRLPIEYVGSPPPALEARTGPSREVGDP